MFRPVEEESTTKKTSEHEDLLGLKATSLDLKDNPLGLNIGPLGFSIPYTLTETQPKEPDDVDLFDKCMRDVMRGNFGHGKYHFTEYKFCKGWFHKKFSDEVELQTIRYPRVYNALDPNESFESLEKNSEEVKKWMEEKPNSNEELWEKVKIYNLNMRYLREKGEITSSFEN